MKVIEFRDINEAKLVKESMKYLKIPLMPSPEVTNKIFINFKNTEEYEFFSRCLSVLLINSILQESSKKIFGYELDMREISQDYVKSLIAIFQVHIYMFFRDNDVMDYETFIHFNLSAAKIDIELVLTTMKK